MTTSLLAFGAPAVVVEGESHALPFERRSQLFVNLALRRAWVGRAELAALLWPDLERRLAHANLRKTLFRLREVPWARAVDVREGAARVQVDTDVHGFEDALRDGRPEEVLRGYRGDLLAGFDDEANEAWTQWLRFERDRLRTAWRATAIERLAANLAPADALALCARLVEADPLDEAAIRAQVTWLARGGHVSRARDAYQAYAGRLRRELGLEPGVELARLHAALEGGGHAPAPAAPPGPAAAYDGFVGRAAELRTLEERLGRRECRLLCVLGPGGVGKTRLARRAMRMLGPRFAHGATFVALEDVDDPGEIGARVARELGVRVGGGDALAQAIEALRERELLLVLDNLEHLAHGAPLLERLLAAAPRVKVLATSRVRLATPSEWTMPLTGLPCPGAEDADRLEAFDAARLFANAARRAGVDVVQASEADAIADICRRVDGLPLALELAAAWTRVLPCAAIAEELRRGADLLRTPDGSMPSRHASVESVFEQSWRLLGPAERDALARLSVFRSGFTPGAAHAVGGVALPVLAALVDKSLLHRDGARLDMHPLVQQLAALRLEGAARDAAEAAHAKHFHRMLAQSRRAADDGDRDALRAIETELENARVAWRWAVANDAGGALAASAATLMHFCDHRGRFAEGVALLREAADAPLAAGDPALRARLLGHLAHLEYRLDRYADAMRSAAQALEGARAARDREAVLQCLKVLGGCSLRLARHDDARRYYGRALRLAATGTDPHTTAAMVDNLALVAKYAGDYDEALRLSLRSLDEHRKLGDAAGEALCLNNVGALCLDIGRHDAAAAHLDQGLGIAVRHGFVATRALLVANLTELALKNGDLEATERRARESLELARTAGLRSAEAVAHMRLAQVAVRRLNLPEARAALADGLALARAIEREALQVACLGCFADLLAAQGEAACARRVLAYAAEHPAATAADREAMRTRLAAWPAAAGTAPAWPDLSLAGLVERIVAEAPVAHGPLIGLLRDGAARLPSVR